MLRLLLSEGLSPSLSHAHVCVISHKCGLEFPPWKDLARPSRAFFFRAHRAIATVTLMPPATGYPTPASVPLCSEAS